jgi:hypothetical protein
MSDEEPQGFKVVDRRQAVAEPTAEGKPAAGASAAPEPDPIPAETPNSAETEPSNRAADDEPGMPDPALLLSLAAMQLDVSTLARLLISVFDGQAWRAMGLLADPRTGEARKDLPSAQLAIDCVQFLLGKVEAGLPDDERREVQRRLNDLRMNYLSKLREG